MKTVLILTCLLVQQASDEKEIESKISSMTLSVNFKDAPLPSVVDYLREVSDLNIVIDTRVIDPEEVMISLTVKDLSMKSILQLMFTGKDINFGVQSGVLMISTQEEFDKNLNLRIYDIRDILYPIKDFPGVHMTLEPDGGIGTIFNDEADESEPLPVEELIRSHTGGETWDSASGATVNLNNGLLVVKNTKAVHLQVRRLLNLLRRNK